MLRIAYLSPRWIAASVDPKIFPLAPGKNTPKYKQHAMVESCGPCVMVSNNNVNIRPPVCAASVFLDA